MFVVVAPVLLPPFSPVHCVILVTNTFRQHIVLYQFKSVLMLKYVKDDFVVDRVDHTRVN